MEVGDGEGAIRGGVNPAPQRRPIQLINYTHFRRKEVLKQRSICKPYVALKPEKLYY